MAAVVFTKSPSTAKRSAGLTILSDWWRASELSKNPIYKTASSYDGLVRLWENTYPNSIDWLGEQLNDYSYDQMIKVVKDIAKENPTVYIKPYMVSNKLIGLNQQKGTFTYLSEAIGETVDDIGSAVVGISRVGLFLSICFFLVLGYIFFKTYFEVAKKGMK